MAEDLSRDAIARRKAAEEAARAAQAFQGVTERPELVLYANEADVSVQADGSVVIRLTYHDGAGHEVRCGDVVMPPAAFATVVAKGHAAMQGAVTQLEHVTGVLTRAVTKRTAMMGDTQGPAGPSRDAIARARREAAGD